MSITISLINRKELINLLLVAFHLHVDSDKARALSPKNGYMKVWTLVTWRRFDLEVENTILIYFFKIKKSYRKKG
jgi:hypothetical protein